MIEKLRIKEAIKEYRTSVNEVSAKMGISRFTLNSHITGNPSTEVLLRIADAIGCNVIELFEKPHNNETTITCPKCGTDIHIDISIEK